MARSFVFKCVCSDGHVRKWHFLNEHGKTYKITHDYCTKCCIISEAHAQRYLKECQGIELQKVQVLIPTTRILNAHCKVELLELHPSDNREEMLQQEAYI